MRLSALLLALLATPLAAHELWLEPVAYDVAADGRVEVRIVNGQKFGGSELVYLPSRIASVSIEAEDASVSYEGRAGDRPGIMSAPAGQGVNMVAYASTPTVLNYEDWAKFDRFITHKDLVAPQDVHVANGWPLENFQEVYSRFSKALVTVGDPGDFIDRALGLETEFTLLESPYTDPAPATLRARLTYQNAPRADVQVEVFEKPLGMEKYDEAQVVIATYRTDADGVVTVPVKTGHAYQFDAVVLRSPSAELAGKTGAVYETLWANLVFAVPE